MKASDLENEAPDGWFSQFDIEIFVPEIQNIPENGLYLEIGVNRGRSFWIAKKVAKPSVEIWGIDELENPNISGTNYIQSDSHLVEWDKPIDVLFIDANHSYEDCKQDIEKYSPFVKKGGVILFHDCDETSPGVVQAVNEFSNKVELFKKEGKNTSMARVKL